MTGFLSVAAQSTRQAAVELTAAIGPAGDRITLRWTPDAQAGSHTLYRKFQTASDWGAAIAILTGDASEWVDSTLLPGFIYEYRVQRQGSGYQGHGYLSAGIEVPHRPFQGRVVLVVDSTILEPLLYEIERLVRDLEGDGWTVVRLAAGRAESPPAVRGRIWAVWNEDKLNTRSLFLLGHVPVPYSGDINPDGHPDHLGAWPADVYYGDVNGTWTDVSVNNTVATGTRNDNIPGDGKFDQSLLPSDVELQVGRVDFANMPAFADSEVELLRAYLEKDHAYRHHRLEVSRRGIVDDNFGYFSGEAFAASAWKSFTPLVGAGHVTGEDYFTALTDSSALWSYGCGGGSYTSASGIGTTAQFAGSDTRSVFTMLFGSYFGDWDVENSFLRAPLAQGLTLTNAWSGRPHWQFHRMGMGETIGHCARMTQNNAGSLYHASYGARFTHIALMGDPTLRNHMITPVPVVTVQAEGYGTRITWSPSPDATDGYLVYMRPLGTATYTLLTAVPVADTLLTMDCLGEPGCYEVMVRVRSLTTTPSGSYYNLSQGVAGSFCQTAVPDVVADAAYEINESTVAFMNASVNADTYLWLFGDGASSTEENPVHTYLDGDFTAMLIASNPCESDTVTFDFTVFTSVSGADMERPIRVYPNPVSDVIWIEMDRAWRGELRADVFALDGRRVAGTVINDVRTSVSLEALPAGVYRIIITGEGIQRTILVVKG